MGPEDQAIKNRYKTNTALNNTARVSYEPTKSRLNAADLKKAFNKAGTSMEGPG